MTQNISKHKYQHQQQNTHIIKTQKLPNNQIKHNNKPTTTKNLHTSTFQPDHKHHTQT